MVPLLHEKPELPPSRQPAYQHGCLIFCPELAQ
jgi:hypothetical protein